MDAVDAALKILLDEELLPLLYAEPVLLVRNDQCEISEVYVIRKERMRADND